MHKLRHAFEMIGIGSKLLHLLCLILQVLHVPGSKLIPDQTNQRYAQDRQGIILNLNCFPFKIIETKGPVFQMFTQISHINTLPN